MAKSGFVVGAKGAPRQRTQTGLDFSQVKGFAQIIVGSCVQARHPLLCAVARGQYQHGGSVAPRSGFSQQGQRTGLLGVGAIVCGQVQVQKHHIKRLYRPKVLRVF